MQTLPLTTITIQTRQRKHFDKHKIEELAESIATKGLLHPIVLTRNHILVAGERRFRAITLLSQTNRTFTHDSQPIPLNHIPFTYITDTDIIRLREIELEENIIREDLTWQERVTAIEELHSLRSAQHPKHTVADTAREIAKDTPVMTAHHRVSRALILADQLDNPDVANAKNEKTAYKIATRAIHAQLERELRKRAIAAPSNHTLLHGDALILMRDLQPQQFDCILVDPPYGIDLHEAGKVADLEHHYDDSPENALEIAKNILVRGLTLCKPDAHLYMFCDIERFFELRNIAEDIGWIPFRTPLIWAKSGASGHTPFGLKGFRRTYEAIMFAYIGTKPFNQTYNDVLNVSEVRGKVVAAQKPVELYEQLLARSCIGNMRVLDPCCGCGTIFHAARKLGVAVTGIELNDKAWELANDAMNQSDETKQALEEM